ncbi:L-aspartate oxidase [Patescibacteria group bacterium]|nr:L-aspartate oxidase [Patescibacteria group bacterium]MBU1672873.1 L-aspartate oxidase [Patescibacteria group bacterium]MBU1963124.1 L-aspartate oxidase [Patescibacteria group bacterium]
MKYKTDFLVIGSGIAGLNFALKAAKHGKVAVVTKKELMESNSNYAQGGIAAVLDPVDNFKSHVEDTYNAGGKIGDKKAIEIMIKEAPQKIDELIDLGVGFNRIQGKLDLAQEGGHSRRRIVHAKDATGREIERALVFNIRHNSNIEVFEANIVVDLIVKNGKCLGAYALDTDEKKINSFFAKATVLATGGAGRVFKNSSNPKIATGDGLAMAYRAGAELQDLEFVQFHPTALNKKGYPHYLISEAIRGEGGKLLNSKRKRFVKELAPRDIVSRAIVEEEKTGPVYLDVRHLGEDEIKRRFPGIYDQLWWYGIFMEKDLIPVAPAAHFNCGGVVTDLNGKTGIEGLYAFGEVARTGVHGGNRLASNALLECMVFSGRALKAAKNFIQGKRIIESAVPRLKIININDRTGKLRRRMQAIMWENVGVVRNRQDLAKTIGKLEKIEEETGTLYKKGVNAQIIELRNMIEVAKLIAESAYLREKSVGTHHIAKN